MTVKQILFDEVELPEIFSFFTIITLPQLNFNHRTDVGFAPFTSRSEQYRPSWHS